MMMPWPQFGLWFPAYLVVFAILTALVHLAFAAAVWNDASALGRQGVETVLVGRLWWALATLLGGVFVAGLYWAMNRSSLRPGWASEGKPEADDVSGLS